MTLVFAICTTAMFTVVMGLLLLMALPLSLLAQLLPAATSMVQWTSFTMKNKIAAMFSKSTPDRD